MKSKSLLFSIVFVFILVLTSCDQEKSNQFQQYASDCPFNIHSIIQYKDTLYATGGDVWNVSYLIKSSDGRSWTTDSLTNKSIFDLYTDNKTLYGVGTDGYIFSGTPSLRLTRTKYWDILRAFTACKDDFIAAGGKDWNKGWIYKINASLQVDTAFYFDHELLDVACLHSGTCFACGYGAVFSSINNGKNWIRSEENGDYYQSIAINGKGEAFMVGYNGTIVYSTDRGESWKKLKDGHLPWANNKPFRKIKFEDDLGIIVGDNGLIWLSHNNGQSWEDISIDSKLNLYDFEFYDSKIVCASENGSILVVEL